MVEKNMEALSKERREPAKKDPRRRKRSPEEPTHRKAQGPNCRYKLEKPRGKTQLTNTNTTNISFSEKLSIRDSFDPAPGAAPCLEKPGDFGSIQIQQPQDSRDRNASPLSNQIEIWYNHLLNTHSCRMDMIRPRIANSWHLNHISASGSKNLLL